MAAPFEQESLVMTLPLLDEDYGVTEALRREAEAEHDPSVVISCEEFQRGIAAMCGR